MTYLPYVEGWFQLIHLTGKKNESAIDKCPTSYCHHHYHCHYYIINTTKFEYRNVISPRYHREHVYRKRGEVVSASYLMTHRVRC